MTSFRPDCTGVILAGGMGRRLNGRDKALIQIGGRPILDYIYRTFSSLFDDIILVTNQPQSYLDWDLYIATDLFPVRSSLTGIHAGLFYSSTPYAFVSACDTPFIQVELIKKILERMDSRFDTIMPETQKGLEPLCAVYARSCLPRIEQALSLGQYKIQRIFKSQRIGRISEDIIRSIDANLTCFYNINTPEDMEHAERLLNAGSLNQPIDRLSEK
ncbi:MAG TPA: molybdenum cofactor guanylyltransferase [Desulfatirhabdiaceae bacterium]|nr:molybdenum cofactor guanylyltransferase [Desulfatirhabdiaceae bacterium]